MLLRWGALDLFQAQPRRIREQPHPCSRWSILEYKRTNLAV